MKLSQLSKIFSLTVGLMLIAMIAKGTTYYSRKTGNWSSKSTWSLTSGGGQATRAPGVYDDVIIEKDFNVTVDQNVSCASITFSSTTASTLTFYGTYTLTVSGTFKAGIGTVEYSRAGDQTVAPHDYNNLIFSGSGSKKISSEFTITGNLLIKSGVKANIGTDIIINTGSLTLGTTNKTHGTWGSSKSDAQFIDDVYFYFYTTSIRSGYLNVLLPPFLNVSINATGGGPVCLGSNKLLTSSGTANIINYYWQGPNDFFSTSQNPQIKFDSLNMSGRYTVTGSSVSGVNLLTNGDFENGYDGLNSTTTGYTRNTVSLQDEKTYAVIAVPQSEHNDFCTCPDHTANGTLQMVINGSDMKDVPIWSQRIPVNPNSNYQYSYWVQSVVGRSPAEIQLTINGDKIGPANVATVETGIWTNVIYNWNSGSTQSANIALINQNITASGNDFALDDIVFQEVAYATSYVDVTVNPLSVGGTLNGTATICSGTVPNDLTLTGNVGEVQKWQKSADAVFTSPIDIPGTTTTLTGTTIGPLTTTTYFRALVKSSPCSEIFSSTAIITVTPTPTATISYSGSTFCKSLSIGQTVTLTGTGAFTGGTFSAMPTGLSIDPETGAITPSLSKSGDYTVTYTMTTPCGDKALPVTTSVSIATLPIADFIYQGSPIPSTINGGVKGTFSSTTGLNFVSTTTGEVNLLTSTPGTYTVTNTVAESGGCSEVKATAQIGITSHHTFAFIWTGTVSTDWNNPHNWLPDMVPIESSDVIIPNKTTTNHDPLIPKDTAAIISTISLEANSNLNGGNATTLTVAGSDYSWQNSGGTLSPGTSTVKFTNPNAGMSGATSFFNVQVPSGDGLTLQLGNLMQVSGALIIQGTLNANTNPNTIEYNGADQTVISPNGSVPGYSNLILSGSGTKTFPATTTVGGNLTIASGAIANISPTVNLTVSGTITNNNGNTGLVLKSDATGTASLMHSTDNVPATVQRYIPGAAEAWHFISPPVSDQSISDIWLPSGKYANGNGYDLYVWNEPSSCWIYQLNTTTPINWNTVHPETNFVAGRGYLYSLQDPNLTKTFVGTLNNGLVAIPLKNILNADITDVSQKGFNFVGNPYPSAIDWQALLGWDRSGLTDSNGGYDMWIWNPDKNNYGVINSASESTGTNDVTRYISSAQGFFVLASSPVDLKMDNRVRVNDQSTLFKNAKIYRGKLNVVVKSESSNSSDEVMLLFGNKTNNTGSRKLFSNVSTAPSLYLPYSADKFTVRYLTDTTDNPSVPLMFKAGKDGNYSLETNFDFTAFQTVTLEDRKMHLFQNLKTNNIYRFQASKSDDPNRFVVYFGKTNITAPQKLSAKVYTTGFNLVVDLTQVNKETIVKVYDIMGRMILQNRLQANCQTNLNINPQKQIVLVYLLNSDGSYFSKLLW